MDFPVFLNKWIIEFFPIKYTPFWYWYRLINHSDWRMDDYQRYWDFWMSINRGYGDMNYKWEFEKFWGKGSYPPKKIIISKEGYDALIEAINKPPEYNEKIAKVLSRKTPWDEEQ